MLQGPAPRVEIAAGTSDDRLGTDAARVAEAIVAADDGDSRLLSVANQRLLVRRRANSGLASPDIRGDFTHLLAEDPAGVGIMQQSSKIGFERCALFPEQVRCGA
jgi:hypothetical protein